MSSSRRSITNLFLFGVCRKRKKCVQSNERERAQNTATLTQCVLIGWQASEMRFGQNLLLLLCLSQTKIGAFPNSGWRRLRNFLLSQPETHQPIFTVWTANALSGVCALFNGFRLRIGRRKPELDAAFDNSFSFCPRIRIFTHKYHSRTPSHSHSHCTLLQVCAYGRDEWEVDNQIFSSLSLGSFVSCYGISFRCVAWWMIVDERVGRFSVCLSHLFGCSFISFINSFFSIKRCANSGNKQDFNWIDERKKIATQINCASRSRAISSGRAIPTRMGNGAQTKSLRYRCPFDRLSASSSSIPRFTLQRKQMFGSSVIDSRRINTKRCCQCWAFYFTQQKKIHVK